MLADIKSVYLRNKSVKSYRSAIYVKSVPHNSILIREYKPGKSKDKSLYYNNYYLSGLRVYLETHYHKAIVIEFI